MHFKFTWNLPHSLGSRLIGCSLLLQGCSVVSQPAPVQRLAAWNQQQANSDYRINQGDELEVRFFYAPELTTTVVVRPDGKISLPFIGDVKVLRRSPKEVAAELRKSYGPQLPRPEVSVNVKTFAAQRIFVGGEVAHPGVQPLVGSVSVMQVIMAAQGFTDRADAEEVVVIRRGDGNERMVFSVNLEAAISGEDGTQDVLLQASDVVVVPRNGVSNVNIWVDQYIRRNIPVGLFISYQAGVGQVVP